MGEEVTTMRGRIFEQVVASLLITLGEKILERVFKKDEEEQADEQGQATTK